jgi:hypothetical protein
LQKRYGAFNTTIITLDELDYDLRTMAHDSKINTISRSEIDERIFQWPTLKNKIINNFEGSNLGKSFVDARCCYNEMDILSEKGGPLLSETFSDFIKDNEHSCLLTFGDFGTGKTSAVQNLVYSICKRTPKGELPYIYPLYVRLKDYQKIQEPISFIFMDISRRYGLSIDKTIFEQFIKEKRFLIVLDGFDEMEIMIDRPTILKNLTLLKTLSSYPTIKYIITCRTHLFRHNLSIANDDNTTSIFLYPWGKEEWKLYSQKIFLEDWKDFYNKIINSKNLRNLARIPRFLDMVANKPDITPKTSEGEMFESYISHYLSEEEKSSILPKPDKEVILEEIAVQMLRGGGLSIPFSEIIGTVKTVFKNRDYNPSDLEKIANDIILSTLLVRTKVFSGAFEFSNPSFFEFFIAKRVIKEIEKDSYDILNVIELPESILQFIGDLFRKENKSHMIFKAFESSPTGYAKSNLLSIHSFISGSPSKLLLEVLAKETSRGVRQTAIRLINQLEVTIPIKELMTLYDNERHEPIRREIINSLEIKNKKEKILLYQFLIYVLKNDPSPDIQNLALDILEKNADDIIRRSLINDVKELKQIRHKEKVLKILGEKPSKELIPAFEALLNDDNSEIRQISIENLGKIRTKKANDLIIVKLKTDPEPWVRKHCAISLSCFSNSKSIKALCQSLTNDTDEEVRKMSAKSLGEIKNSKATDALINAIQRDSLAIVRWYSAEALGHIGDIKAIPFLQAKMEDDPHHIVRKYCRLALKEMGELT